ncbi:MAG TPA: TonB-dependent receptor [Paludibacter sp.]|nr:TonB-dependent receptor [Paludibacter sp.]
MKKLIFIPFFLMIVQIVFAQNWKVSGVVTDSDDGQPLLGVNVIVKGVVGIGTITDLDGKFTINVPQGKSLSFTYVGYKEQIKEIKGNVVLNIALSSDTKMLDEMVVIGYGTMKKSDLTGSVTSIKSDALQKTPAAGLDQALQGRAAGVTVNANSGQPGAGAVIRIRGIGSVMGGSDPIYVVDGMITTNISFLNPNDIESTEVLKDASATAIYGSRGANGVILVTTKRGKEGKTNISLNVYSGIQNRWNKLDLMQRDEFVKTVISLNNITSEKNFFKNYGFNKWLAAYRLGNSPYFPKLKTDANPSGMDYSTVETDWQDEVFNENALVQNYHISFDGGTAKDSYNISAGYFNQDGTIVGSNYKRFTFRLNSSHKMNSWFKIGENLAFNSSTGRNAMNNNSSPGASVLSAALAMAPWDPTRYPEGSVNNVGKDLSGQIAASSNFRNVTNPYSMVEMAHPMNKAERWVGDVHIEITPFKGLMFRSAVNFDHSYIHDQLFKEAYEYSSYDKSDLNFFQRSITRYNTMIYENTLTYNKSFDKHSLTAMVGQTTEEYNFYTLGGSGASILNPVESNWYLKSTTENKTYAGDGVDRSRMFSLLGRIHYSYGSKYMVTLNFRGDSSSRFPSNPWGYFPSTALAWRISEESWMKDIKQIDNLKLRLGWGRIGNANVPTDAFNSVMFSSGPTFVDYVFGANQSLASGATMLTIPNKNGRWETAEQVNAAIDFGLLGGKLNGSIDFFSRNTIDALLYVKAPAQVGNRYDPIANVGNINNKGIEISLDHQNKIGEIKYGVSGNISFIKNELTKLNGGDPIYGDRVKTDQGLALFTLWGYKYEGIYKSDADALQHLFGYTPEEMSFHAGDAKFADLDGNGKIDDYDKTDLGNAFPSMTYGLNLSAEYLGFDLQLFMQGVVGNEIYNAVRERTEGKGDMATLSTTMRNVWTASNTSGTIPNPFGTSLNMANSSRFVEDGSYIRLKNVQLGYTLPAKLTKSANINRARFYLSGSNLLTFTNYTGYDPEVGSGVDYGNYPQSRTITVGVNLDF